MSFHTCREKDSSPSPVKLSKPEGIGQSRESEVEDRVGGSSLKSNYVVAFCHRRKFGFCVPGCREVGEV